MAGVIVPSPQTSIAMSTRRPLASVPNATNSPHRGGLLATKRPRPTNSQADGSFSQPPLKKQLLTRGNGEGRSPQKFVYQSTETKQLFTRKNNAQPSAFERKLVAARDKPAPQPMHKPVKRYTAESVESVRQWQRHYRKVFPKFVFYFDHVTEEVRQRCAKQVSLLGARDERFFSKYVTHVVTTRPLPPELDTAQSFNAGTSNDARVADTSAYTVNPSVLERGTEPSQSHLGRGRGRNGLEKRTADPDGKRDLSGQVDVLHRARQMEMKIWPLDKLQRVVTAMNDGDPTQHGYPTRSNVAASRSNAAVHRSRADLDLSAVLRHERLNRPFDHNSLGLKDLIPFKGFFIYVYDYYGKTRPVVIRDYPRVTRRHDGVWPQFRSAALGKCPFIEDPQSKKEAKQEKAQAPHKEQKPTAKDNQAVSAIAKEMAPPPSFEKPASKPQQGDNRRKAAQCMNGTQQSVGHEALPRTNFASGTASTQPLTAYSRAEIAASGIQPSNITSAIRSQMISSTTAAPGAKTGTSKEIHELKRKVLEKNNGTMSMSQRFATSSTVATAVRVPPTRSSKMKALETLGVIPEDTKNQPQEDRTQKTRAVTKRHATIRTTIQKKDPKPGYCENCREKFDVFEEHIASRQHRKFALTDANWDSLDELLESLERVEKDVYHEF